MLAFGLLKIRIVLPSQRKIFQILLDYKEHFSNSIIIDFTDCPNIGETVQNGACACVNTGETVQNGVCACPANQIVQNGACESKKP